MLFAPYTLMFSNNTSNQARTMKIFWLGVALGHLFWLGKAEVDFNVEIEKRVMERLADFMEIPVCVQRCRLLLTL